MSLKVGELTGCNRQRLLRAVDRDDAIDSAHTHTHTHTHTFTHTHTHTVAQPFHYGAALKCR